MLENYLQLCNFVFIQKGLIIDISCTLDEETDIVIQPTLVWCRDGFKLNILHLMIAKCWGNDGCHPRNVQTNCGLLIIALLVFLELPVAGICYLNWQCDFKSVLIVTNSNRPSFISFRPDSNRIANVRVDIPPFSFGTRSIWGAFNQKPKSLWCMTPARTNPIEITLYVGLLKFCSKVKRDFDAGDGDGALRHRVIHIHLQHQWVQPKNTVCKCTLPVVSSRCDAATQ